MSQDPNQPAPYDPKAQYGYGYPPQQPADGSPSAGGATNGGASPSGGPQTPGAADQDPATRVWGERAGKRAVPSPTPPTGQGGPEGYTGQGYAGQGYADQAGYPPAGAYGSGPQTGGYPTSDPSASYGGGSYGSAAQPGGRPASYGSAQAPSDRPAFDRPGSQPSGFDPYASVNQQSAAASPPSADYPTSANLGQGYQPGVESSPGSATGGYPGQPGGYAGPAWDQSGAGHGAGGQAGGYPAPGEPQPGWGQQSAAGAYGQQYPQGNYSPDPSRQQAGPGSSLPPIQGYAPQTYPGAQGFPGQQVAPRTEDNPIRALFDLSFGTWVTPSVIKFLYVLLLVVGGLNWVVAIWSGFTFSALTGIAALIGGALLLAAYVLGVRVTLEYFLATIRVAQQTRDISATVDRLTDNDRD